MDQKRVCEVTYRAILAKRAKTFYIKPYKIFSHRETIYLHAGLAPKPGKRYRAPDFDTLLAINRIVSVALTDRPFTVPEGYDFEKTFNRNFGVIKEEAFEAEMEFSGFAAGFVAERIWSLDQKTDKLPGGRIRLRFSASSEPELKAWILSFGDEAKVIGPDWLKAEIAQTIGRMGRIYQGEEG
jgi:predicted DNA-binding transcriptional regulator YafY